jgi:hypothetical protein
MSGINSSTYNGVKQPHGVPNPTRKAINGTTSTTVYSRRYLDWNRLTFEYHAVGSQTSTFDYHSGLRVTDEITSTRQRIGITALFGCAPASYCFSCAPFNSPGNIFSILSVALAATVINPARSTIPRLIILNTGSVRFGLFKGSFTYDGSFIVSPFDDSFQYIPNVPYSMASKVLAGLNGAPLTSKKRSDPAAPELGAMPLPGHDHCVNPTLGPIDAADSAELKNRGVQRRQATEMLTLGYTTQDDFGTDGDDTPHLRIPQYPQPNYFQGNASLPVSPSPTTPIDLIFLDFIAPDVLEILTSLGGTYTTADIAYYLPNTGPDTFTA